MIDRRIPKERYILFDTKKQGCRPDTMQMLRDVYDAFEAEGTFAPRVRVLGAYAFLRYSVVIITSNPQGNAELMRGCKENGMHSFGPLWDS